MKKFNVSCIDDATNMEVLLAGCSYNNACNYLSLNGFNWENAKMKVDYRTNRTLFYHEDKTGKIIDRVFCYDENRGLLLGD